MKEGGSPKDLNKAIERNQWYARTLDDILLELAQSKYFTVKDATSGFWHMPLDLRSSLLTTFNTPWGKYRWLRMPFGLKVSGDVFQERLDRVPRLVLGVLGIVDDIVIHGATENTHNGTVLVLFETVRLNNLSLNAKKMQFKSTDCKFFGHKLTPDGIKVDPKKIEAIIQMDPNKNMWTPAEIVQCPTREGRSYSLRTIHGGVYTRNRRFIKPDLTATEALIPKPSARPVATRLTRIIKKPDRLIESK